MKLFIKNMVCTRCIMVVTQVLKKMKLQPFQVELGGAELEHALTEQELTRLSKKLKKLGF